MAPATSSNSTIICRLPTRRRLETILIGCFLLFGTTVQSTRAFLNSPTSSTKTTMKQSIDFQLRMVAQDEEEESDSDITSTNPKRKSLSELLLPIDTCKVNQMSGTDLAYIGDVVFELFVRSRHVWPSKRTSDLQNTVVAIVRAEHQSQLLAQLKEDFALSDKEKQILMRGRNAVTRSKNRRNPAAYQDSTSFEALLGYLYIEDQERCCDLLNWLESVVDKI